MASRGGSNFGHRDWFKQSRKRAYEPVDSPDLEDIRVLILMRQLDP